MTTCTAINFLTKIANLTPEVIGRQVATLSGCTDIAEETGGRAAEQTAPSVIDGGTIQGSGGPSTFCRKVRVRPGGKSGKCPKAL